MAGSLVLSGCEPAVSSSAPPASAELVLLHTSDLHSHVFPTWTVPSALDQARGLGEQGVGQLVGGFARLGGLLEAERSLSTRHLYLDSGDLWQGSRAYAEFGGEAELAGMAALSLDAAVPGNHDLDDGVAHFEDLQRRFGSFPVLATNYLHEGGGMLPWIVLDAGGLRVGLVGVANVESVGPLEHGSRRFGVVPLATARAVEGALAALGAQADVIVALTHLGLDADRALVRETSGLDVVLGGHQHLTLDEAVVEHDATGRGVVIVHSGAYGRYLGRLRVALSRGFRAADGLEVVEHDFSLLAVSEGLPEDASVARALAGYEEALRLSDHAFGYAEVGLTRSEPGGGDSALGNLVADAALAAAPADVALLTSSSLRADLEPGSITADDLYRILPFDDPLVRVQVSGRELDAWFARMEDLARRYGCETPVQLAGGALRLECESSGARRGLFVRPGGGACATDADCGEGACAGTCWDRAAPDDLYAITTTRFLLDDYAESARPTEQVADTLRAAVEQWVAERGRCFEGLPCVRAVPEGRIALE